MDLVFIILSIVGVVGLILFLPIKGTSSFTYTPPVRRIHEADAVLSRRLLKPGTQPYETYYKVHPDYKHADDQSRQSPGLLSHRARQYDPGTFAAAKANFEIIESMFPDKVIVNPQKISIKPEKVSRFLSQWLKKTGAHSVGITRLEDYHLYSHKGRGPRAGEPIMRLHDYAVAITVEMDHKMMLSAPKGSSVMESSEQYLRSGVLALKAAAYIRELGYEAVAHIDGNYDVICPLVAVDAGLGVIGRMGLLMTPTLGSRIRISVVTTNMPLTPSISKPEATTLHFSSHCKKCAHVCPAAAIPEGPRTEVDGIERWRISSEKCYHYWTISGTDCGRCMTSCPYSHPDNWFHRFIRWAIKNNLVFRRMAIKLDDIFYGRKPPIRSMPSWSHIEDKQ